MELDDSPAYEVTFWGKRAFIESLSEAIEAAPEGDRLGWLQLLIDLLADQGLQWREHVNPASGYPFVEHADGMPPVPLSQLRATKPELNLGHSPFADRSNLSATFHGTDDVAKLLSVAAQRVPGLASVHVRLIADQILYDWWYDAGKVQRSESRGLS